MTDIPNTDRFAINLDFTGICRMKAAKVMAESLGQTWNDLEHGYHNETETLTMTDGRKWHIVYNEDVEAQEYEDYTLVDAGRGLSNQLITPLLKGHSLVDFTHIMCALKKAGAFANKTCNTTIIHFTQDGDISVTCMPTNLYLGWDEPAEHLPEY